MQIIGFRIYNHNIVSNKKEYPISRFHGLISVFERYYIIMNKKIIRPFDYYALLFFTTAFAGWLWEVLLCLVTAHTFVNRGVYKGPYLPIYGIGCVILLMLLHRLRKRK